MGTPKYLDDAITHALCIGPLNETPERAYAVLRDFMAQKFGVAVLGAGDDTQVLELLENLFAELTARRSE